MKSAIRNLERISYKDRGEGTKDELKDKVNLSFTSYYIMLYKRKILIKRWFILYTIGLFYFFSFGLNSSEARVPISLADLSRESSKDVAYSGSRAINLIDYKLNEGEGYELSFQQAQEYLPLYELVIWQDDFKDPSRSSFISVVKMKDFEGRPVNLEESLQIFLIDLDGDLSEEILLIPRILFGNKYRATILKRFFDYYQPLAISEITGDYYYVVDIRDLNRDQYPDLILGCSSGASSYQDIREIFWFSNNQLHRQVFHQWVRLRDFNRDGLFELLVDSVGGTSGAHSQWAYWTDIYVWNPDGYKKDNARYPEYYEQELIPGYISEILSYSENSEEETGVTLDRISLIQRAQNIIQQGTGFSTSDPVKIKLLNQRGKEFLNQNKLEEALSEFTQAFYLEPYNLEIIQDLIQIYLTRGDYERAIRYSFRAIQLAPEQEVVWESLGYSYLKQGQYDKAIQCFDNYLRYASDVHQAAQTLLDLSNKETDEKIRLAIQKTLTD